MIDPVQDVRNKLEQIKRKKNQSNEDLAEEMYDLQMEIYSSWGGFDLWQPFHQLPKEIQEGWIKAAKEKE